MLALNGPKVEIMPMMEYIQYIPIIINEILVCSLILLSLVKNLIKGSEIEKADIEPKIIKIHWKNEGVKPFPIIGRRKVISLYFSVIRHKIIELIINEDTDVIIKISNVLKSFPIKNNDGKMKNIIMYHTGVSIKKFVLIQLASTAAASTDARKSPKAKINKKIFPKIFESPRVNISFIS